jgi:uncharacterized protein
MTIGRRMGAALALLLAPAALAAQERGAFVLKVGGDTLAVERFTRTGEAVEGELFLRPQGRVWWRAPLGADGAASAFEMRAWAGGAAADAPPQQEARLAFDGDTARLTARTPAGEQSLSVGGARGAVPFVNPSALAMEQILVQARRSGGRDTVRVPVLAVGAASVTRATVAWVGADSASLSLGPVEVRARVDAAGRLLGARVPAQNLTIERAAGEVAAAAGPDYSAPAGAPYTAEEVAVPTPGGWTLAGTLTLPKERRGRVPAVVTITGSGQQDRDERLTGVGGYRPMRQVADTLGRRGIAVLRFDDRGAGASGGAADSATTADFADDVRAVVAYLRSRPEIDPDRIALVGHSEGGVIAPMVAAEDPRIAGVVLVAGTANTGREVLDYQLRRAIAADTSVAAEKRDSAYLAFRAQFDATTGATPWFRFFQPYDPKATARRVKAPALILQGETDRQVTADQAELLAAAIREGGNRDVTVHVFPGVNHLLLRDPDGSPQGYTRLPDTKVVPELLGVLADWLAAKLGTGN